MSEALMLTSSPLITAEPEAIVVPTRRHAPVEVAARL
jgi:hypothetical protein